MIEIPKLNRVEKVVLKTKMAIFRRTGLTIFTFAPQNEINSPLHVLKLELAKDHRARKCG